MNLSDVMPITFKNVFTGQSNILKYEMTQCGIKIFEETNFNILYDSKLETIAFKIIIGIDDEMKNYE